MIFEHELTHHGHPNPYPNPTTIQGIIIVLIIVSSTCTKL
jgi:hypothetical protein